MSGPLVSASAAFVAKNSRIPPFAIEQSLRFDGGGSKLVLSSPSSSYTTNKFTMSCWVKMGPIASDFRMMSRDGAPSNVENVWCSFNAFGNNVIVSYMYTASINGRGVLNTLGTQRDPSAWYHIVFGFDSSTGNTQRIWVNGVEQTTGKDTISGVAGFAWSSTYPFVIGGGTSHGYVAEYHFIDNTWLNSPNDFGAFDDEGVWRPIEYTGSHGTNGFYLKFDPTAANGIGHDHSGTGNHLTATGFDTTNSTASTYDVMSDTPTTNYCTWNPLTIRNGSGTMSLTEGNLKFGSTASTTYGSILATIAPTSGKYYCELTFEGTKSSNYNRELFGIVPIANWQTNTRVDVHQIPGSLVYESNGTSSLAHQGTGGVANTQSYGVAWDENSNIGIAIDFDTPSLTFYVDGSSQGTFPYSMTAGEAYAIFAVDWSNFVEISAFILNAGQRAFAYTPPSGFLPLNTKNLPAPDIADGSKYFNTVLYTGNGTSQSITGFGFSPDMIWSKSRTNTHWHMVTDQVRGGDKVVWPNDTSAESTRSTHISSFDTDGYTLGADTSSNGSGLNFVAWAWDAGGSGSSNTDGSITSTVSANPSAGFSIVKSQLAGSAVSATYGHGLGVAPKFLIVKPLNTFQWDVYHEDLGNTAYLILNDTAAQTTGASTVWNSTSPTSTVFSLGTAWPTYAGINQDFIAYCFAEVEGYSKFGSYSGGDGVFVYLGFKPSLLILKGTVGTRNWIILDSKRSTYNVVDDVIHPNLSNAESVQGSSSVDFVSNGFVTRGGNISGAGDLTVFAAFAENPFGGSGVNPATAR